MRVTEVKSTTLDTTALFLSDGLPPGEWRSFQALVADQGALPNGFEGKSQHLGNLFGPPNQAFQTINQPPSGGLFRLIRHIPVGHGFPKLHYSRAVCQATAWLSSPCNFPRFLYHPARTESPCVIPLQRLNKTAMSFITE
jgi:hypothetical protein